MYNKGESKTISILHEEFIQQVKVSGLPLDTVAILTRIKIETLHQWMEKKKQPNNRLLKFAIGKIRERCASCQTNQTK